MTETTSRGQYAGWISRSGWRRENLRHPDGGGQAYPAAIAQQLSAIVDTASAATQTTQHLRKQPESGRPSAEGHQGVVESKLKQKVNEKKSAVARPWSGSCGLTVTDRAASPNALDAGGTWIVTYLKSGSTRGFNELGSYISFSRSGIYLFHMKSHIKSDTDVLLKAGGSMVIEVAGTYP